VDPKGGPEKREDDPAQIERLTALMPDMRRASEEPPELCARLGLKAP
jgi:hypothetical protein